MLRAESLTYRIHPPGIPERTLFSNLSAEFSPGTHTVIFGPNGAGKSTLMKILAGLLRPAGGRVFLNGSELNRLNSRDRARSIGWLPQITPLYYNLKVVDIVSLGRLPYRSYLGRQSDDDRDAVQTALEMTELTGFSQRRIFTLSGGEYQRVLLARLIATGSDIMILDEPLTYLDLGHKAAFFTLLNRLKEQGRILISSNHDLKLSKKYTEQSIVLRGDGSYIAGETDNVLTHETMQQIFGLLPEDLL